MKETRTHLMVRVTTFYPSIKLCPLYAQWGSAQRSEHPKLIHRVWLVSPVNWGKRMVIRHSPYAWDIYYLSKPSTWRTFTGRRMR